MNFDIGGQFGKNKEAGQEPEIEEKAAENENALFSWEAPEFQKETRSKELLAASSLAVLAVIVYALISDNPIMAVTFVLIAVVGYIYLQKEPQTITLRITKNGVLADKDFFDFENIHSFWIFYDPPEVKILGLKVKGRLLENLRLPIHREDPTKIRKILLNYIPEKKQDLGLIDVIERKLGI